MAKKLVVDAIRGRIYDAVLSKQPNVMTGNRTDRTDEVIGVVADHMKLMADRNKKRKGFFRYKWKGIGTLTWESCEEEGE